LEVHWNESSLHFSVNLPFSDAQQFDEASSNSIHHAQKELLPFADEDAS